METEISRRDVIEAAVQGVKERETVATPDVSAPSGAVAEKPTAAVSATPEAEKPTIERARDESGKFVENKPKRGRPTNAEREARLEAVRSALRGKPAPAPAEKPEAAKPEEAKPEAAPAAEPVKPVEAAKTDSPKAEGDTVPGALKAHLKAKWGELPQEWREEVRRLEAIGSGAAAKFGPEVNFARELKGVIQQYEPILAAEGATPTQAVKAMFDLVSTLRQGTAQQKQQALQYLAQAYQVPLGGGAEAQEQATDNPYVRQLQEENQRLLQHQRAQLEAQQRQVYESNVQTLREFAQEKDERGNVKHPLDETLGPKFSQHINVVRSENPTWDTRRVLEQAYENLSWTVPELRAVLLERQAAVKRAEVERELAAKKQAAVQVKGSPPDSAAPKIDPRDRRAAIKAAMSQVAR